MNRILKKTLKEIKETLMDLCLTLVLCMFLGGVGTLIIQITTKDFDPTPIFLVVFGWAALWSPLGFIFRFSNENGKPHTL